MLFFFNFAQFLFIELFSAKFHSLPIAVLTAHNNVNYLIKNEKEIVKEKQKKASPAQREVKIRLRLCHFVEIIENLSVVTV